MKRFRGCCQHWQQTGTDRILDGQAARAFIASRKSQGWVCLPESYDDIGQSGGTLKRPALRRLLADMKAGKIDCVVIHTLDRLTRSFSDQEKLSAAFRQCGVTLVTACPVMYHVWGKRMEQAWVGSMPRFLRRTQRWRRDGKVKW